MCHDYQLAMWMIVGAISFYKSIYNSITVTYEYLLYVLVWLFNKTYCCLLYFYTRFNYKKTSKESPTMFESCKNASFIFSQCITRHLHDRFINENRKKRKQIIHGCIEDDDLVGSVKSLVNGPNTRRVLINNYVLILYSWHLSL